MTPAAGSRREVAETSVRRCAECETQLSAQSRSWRRFCSSRCRMRNWDAHNRPRFDAVVRKVRLHWHVGRPGGRLLWGNFDAGYWRGDGCPEECARSIDPGGWSTGVPEGREGLPPQRFSALLPRLPSD